MLSLVSPRRAWAAALLAGAAGLSACADAPVIEAPLYPAYSSGLLQYGATGRPLPVVIAGNPTAAPQAALDDAVVRAMTDANRGGAIHFVRGPEAPFRVEMLVGALPNADGAALCRGAVYPVAVRPQRLRITAAFCQEDIVLSQVTGTTGGVTSPDSPQLAELVQGLTRALFPPENPDDKRGGTSGTLLRRFF